ncbi:DUF551 domain-containing protein [Salmonella enterica subsp. enterica]|nr:DUF551 domain-containing protein [Salmonella enterica subsp. enterica]ECY9916400.1 DUF551 domain-containing protein [Salmonella enterica subsp. enterica]EDX0816189.1 DUF551 domain-containing protein [Salmonella enterica subsp. enterica]EDY1906621.1 DUF551 domain-containing protein [Salmonella enterica subsp. enterica]EGY0938103.1 DUF551 domain-containing protein [Salmonella enterica subsp. enterica]
MNTITNNKLPDERVSNATLIRLIQWAEQHNSHYVAAALCELQERRKADSAEPAGYHVIKECGKVGCSVTTLEEAEKTRDFWNKRWTIRPYFYTQPALVATGATNSPVTPDGWISCSERMPAQDDWVLIYSKYGEYLAGQVQGEYVELNDGTLSWLGAALHWMPLPAAPQQGTTNL